MGGRRTTLSWAVATALLLTAAACGGGSSPRPASSPHSSAPAPTAGSTGAATASTDYTRALPVKIRVVNLYADAGTGTGVDVWAGGEADPSRGRLLATVPYGQVSDPFAPYTSTYAAPDNKTSDGQDVYGYDLGFYLQGKTTSADVVGDQSEDAYPGDVLTIVLAPSTDQNGVGGSMRVVFDHSGPARSDAGKPFETASVPGAALVWLIADGIIPTDPTSDLGVDVAVGGSCLPETGPDILGGADRTLAGAATGQIYFEVAPGTPSISVVTASGTAVPDCGGKSAVEVPLTAANDGDHLLAFVYGPEQHLESLVLPLMT